MGLRSPTATNETTPITAFPRGYSHSPSRFYHALRKSLRSDLKTRARHLSDSIPNPRTGAPQLIYRRIMPRPRVRSIQRATECSSSQQCPHHDCLDAHPPLRPWQNPFSFQQKGGGRFGPRLKKPVPLKATSSGPRPACSPERPRGAPASAIWPPPPSAQ